MSEARRLQSAELAIRTREKESYFDKTTIAAGWSVAPQLVAWTILPSGFDRVDNRTDNRATYFVVNYLVNYLVDYRHQRLIMLIGSLLVTVA